jgi:hypothetical protein
MAASGPPNELGQLPLAEAGSLELDNVVGQEYDVLHLLTRSENQPIVKEDYVVEILVLQFDNLPVQ